jgi:hypothetical protein
VISAFLSNSTLGDETSGMFSSFAPPCVATQADQWVAHGAGG